MEVVKKGGDLRRIIGVTSRGLKSCVNWSSTKYLYSVQRNCRYRECMIRLVICVSFTSYLWTTS